MGRSYACALNWYRYLYDNLSEGAAVPQVRFHYEEYCGQALSEKERQ